MNDAASISYFRVSTFASERPAYSLFIRTYPTQRATQGVCMYVCVRVCLSVCLHVCSVCVYACVWGGGWCQCVSV
jgi:hypothetical protein